MNNSNINVFGHTEKLKWINLLSIVLIHVITIIQSIWIVIEYNQSKNNAEDYKITKNLYILAWVGLFVGLIFTATFFTLRIKNEEDTKLQYFVPISVFLGVWNISIASYVLSETHNKKDYFKWSFYGSGMASLLVSFICLTWIIYNYFAAPNRVDFGATDWDAFKQ